MRRERCGALPAPARRVARPRRERGAEQRETALAAACDRTLLGAKRECRVGSSPSREWRAWGVVWAPLPAPPLHASPRTLQSDRTGGGPSRQSSNQIRAKPQTRAGSGTNQKADLYGTIRSYVAYRFTAARLYTRPIRSDRSPDRTRRVHKTCKTRSDEIERTENRTYISRPVPPASGPIRIRGVELEISKYTHR